MFWILLSFWETRKQDFLPRIRHFNERHACAAAATRVQYKIVHKTIITCSLLHIIAILLPYY